MRPCALIQLSQRTKDELLPSVCTTHTIKQIRLLPKRVHWRGPRRLCAIYTQYRHTRPTAQTDTHMHCGMPFGFQAEMEEPTRAPAHPRAYTHRADTRRAAAAAAAAQAAAAAAECRRHASSWWPVSSRQRPPFSRRSWASSRGGGQRERRDSHVNSWACTCVCACVHLFVCWCVCVCVCKLYSEVKKLIRQWWCVSTIDWTCRLFSREVRIVSPVVSWVRGHTAKTYFYTAH